MNLFPWLVVKRLSLPFALIVAIQGGAAFAAQAQGTGQSDSGHWLTQSPAGFKTFAVKQQSGVVVIDDTDFGQRFFTLLRVAADPAVVERNECTILPALLTSDALAPRLQKGGGCSGKNALRWLGADEFERADIRQKVVTAFLSDIKRWVPKLPQAVLIVDDVKLGEYDAASNAFPLIGADSPPIQALIPISNGENLKQALQFDWPVWRLPVSGTDEARSLIKDVNSWEYASKYSSVPQKAQRMVRRGALIRILGIDTTSQRVDIKLDGVALYNLDLSKEIHRYDVASHPEPAVNGNLPAKFDVASPARLDRFHMNLKLFAATQGDVPDTTWQDLANDLSVRDQEYYGVIPASHGGARSSSVGPFFAKGHYYLRKEQRDAFKNWALAYTAGMPPTFEYIRDYTLNEFAAERKYKFSGIPDGGTGSAVKSILGEGYAVERIVGVPGAQGVYLSLPKNAETYNFEIGGDVLMPFAGKRLLRRTLFELGPEKLLRSEQGTPILVVDAKPLSTRVEFDSAEIKTQMFD